MASHATEGSGGSVMVEGLGRAYLRLSGHTSAHTMAFVAGQAFRLVMFRVAEPYAERARGLRHAGVASRLMTSAAR